MRQLPNRKTIRLNGWDYGRNAAYFVTICTSGRNHFFGQIINGSMHLSEIGVIAQDFWQKIPQHFQHTSLDAYAIMPDHIHGIVIIDKPRGIDETGEMDNMNNGDGNDCRVVACNNPTINKPSEIAVHRYMSSISPKPGSLSTIIRSYKSAVTKRAHQIDPEFAWQSRFYDHVVRNPDSHDRIKQYIHNHLKSKIPN
ncbi:MAG: transposase [Candidatus Marinimicrobia bacterium]|nr:transposase [Candidatus Neomarinimicrobiota bacterium]